MLDPAGDAKQTGRKIGNAYERTLTLTIAQQLKELLEERFPQISVTLTRTPTEVIHPLQNANFSNRLPVDLFISLHCFKDSAPKPTIYLYRYTNQYAFLPTPDLTTCIPYHNAFLIQKVTTSAWLTILYQELQLPIYQSQFTTHGPYAFPCKPLIGIIAPAIAIEMGVTHPDSWKGYIPALADSIAAILNQSNGLYE
jgi:N-acetylmuramoyl-L-alanine amidase